MQDMHDDDDMLVYIMDNLEFLLADVTDMKGTERIERAKMYLLKARTELMTEGKERSSE